MDLVAHRGTQRVRLRHRCSDGSWLWIEVEQIHNGAENPDEVDVVSHISDISEEMAAHEALRRREQLFSRLAESLPSGVAQIQQDLSVVYANARLGTILGITPIPACPTCWQVSSIATDQGSVMLSGPRLSRPRITSSKSMSHMKAALNGVDAP
jgi:PAS domain-containing protein